MIYTVIFLLLTTEIFNTVKSTVEIENIQHNSTSTHIYYENILCRGCGSDITFSGGIISKTSPSSQFSFHASVFDLEEVLIQVLLNDFFILFPMITTSEAYCIGVSKWEEFDTWFPGYHWKPCVCPDCGALVGWVFERTNPSLVEEPAIFFGLILSTLIGESNIDSVTITPEI